MTRKRIAMRLLDSWEQVDETLRAIGELDRDISLLEATANEEIDRAKLAMKASAEPLIGKKRGLELAIKSYCEANPEEFKKNKTRQLTFGSVGFRLSTSIIIKSVADAIQSMKELGLHGFIRTKEAPDKEAMKNLTDETLSAIGAARKTENVFGYEVNQEKIKDVVWLTGRGT